MKQFRIVSLLFFLSALSVSLKGQVYSFENSILSQDALSVRSFAQDPNGLIWIGTDNGLFCYDGYDFDRFYCNTGDHEPVINCILPSNKNYLLLGTSEGVMTFDIVNYAYVDSFLKFTGEVYSIHRTTGDDLWLGTSSGLFKYSLSMPELVQVPVGEGGRFSNGAVYSIDDLDGALFIGNEWGVWRQNGQGGEFVPVFPSTPGWPMPARAVAADREGGRMWFSCVRQTGTCTADGTVSMLNDRVPASSDVQSICVCSSDLVNIGTDGALYSWRADNTFTIKHDSRTTTSLANNNIHAQFLDRDGNLWVGTDMGLSFSSSLHGRRVVQVSAITGESEGNLVSSIFKDSEDRFWMGGSDGIIRANATPRGVWFFSSRTYKDGNDEWRLPSNNITFVCEDSRNNLWVSTNAELCRYDRESEQFVRYSIWGANGHFSKGIVSLAEGPDESLWVFSSGFGIAKMPPKAFESNKAGDRPAPEKSFALSDLQLENNIKGGLVDKRGFLWILDVKGRISVFNPYSAEKVSFSSPDATVSAMAMDSDGIIWAAHRNGVLKIDPLTGTTEDCVLQYVSGNPISLAEVKDEIWIVYSDAIACVDKESVTSRRHIGMTGLGFCLYYDDARNVVLVGMRDAVMVLYPDLLASSDLRKRHISGMVTAVNGVPYVSSDGPSIYDGKVLRLSHKQNSVAMRVSDFEYSKEMRSIIAWRYDRKGQWQYLDKNVNVFSLDNIRRGRHDLEIGYVGDDGEVASDLVTLKIRKAAAWFLSTPAVIVYLFLTLLLLYLVWNYYSLKQRLRKDEEERERQRKQAEMKVSFFTELSHEFKTPLSLILAPLSELLYMTPKEDKRYGYLETINSNALKLSSLVHQVITYYRDGNDASLDLVQSHIDVVPFAEKVFLAHAEGMKARSISFVFNSSHASIFGNVDIVKLESVLNNILSNAEKYTPDGGSISMDVSLDEGGSNIVIRISDTGCGIKPEEQQFIFDRFYQASNSKQNGTGLGLYMAKKFVELQGGTIGVSSDGGQGTEFTITLPVFENEPQESASAVPVIRDDKPAVLIVEDNSDLADFISHVLGRDYVCEVAHNGKAGLEAASRMLPDLIITDVMMPVMDGFEMCRELKSKPRTSTIPIIMLTAKDDKDTELESINLKIESFIPKPFDMSILQSRAQQLIALRRNIEQQVKFEYISTPKEEKPMSQAEKFLNSITSIIEENLSDPEFNVNALSQKAEISQKFLYRKITKLTGLTTVEYIRAIRLKKAAMLLSDQKFAVSEVMYMVGFVNQSYFSKCFSQYFGVTPQQYKSGIRKKESEA